MSSPAKTWTSVLIGLAIAFYLFYNVIQLANGVLALRDQGADKVIDSAVIVYEDLSIGLGGTGVLALLFIIACLVIFLGKEPHSMQKSQRVCFWMIGALILFSMILSFSTYVELVLDAQPKAIAVTSTAFSCARLCILAAIVGCGVHVARNT